jgi:Tfp pilus assembly protein PilF
MHNGLLRFPPPQDPRHRLAIDLFEQAYALQMRGELEAAAAAYRRSIEMLPTAEAYTFLGWTYLGWTYSFMGRVDDAIEQCKNAILVDPTFGNPYNDIGAYLIGQGKHDDAVPWLEKAIAAQRYEARHYPWYNLGRIYVAKELYRRAGECFRKSLEAEPRYTLAAQALDKLRLLVQ